MEPLKKNDRTRSINSFLDTSEISIMNEKKRESTITVTGPPLNSKALADKNLSILASTFEPKKTSIHQESPPAKQMTKSDAHSYENNLSLHTEKEISSPSSPLKKMMGIFGKSMKGLGLGIGSLGKGIGSSLGTMSKGLGTMSKGLGLNILGKGLGALSKHGLKGLNNLSKGLGLDILGKGLNNLSKLGLDQLGKGLKDIGKGLNLRKLQENLMKMAF